MARTLGFLNRVLRRTLDPRLLEKIRSVPTKQNEYGYDPFGFNREDALSAIAVVQYLYRYYFRVQAFGVGNIPDGRVLLIGNHSGQLPFDGLGIGGAVMFERDPPRLVRAMVERYVPTVPFASYLFPRWGQIVGDPSNCKRLLEDEEAILVFPEGARGISKPFWKRYQLEEFGLGFMRLALETRTPVVPVALIGAEEQAPAVNLKPLARLLGAPSFPLTPYLLPLPLPVKYRVYFGEPLYFEGDPDEDEEEMGERVKVVKHAIQSMIQLGLRDRKGIFR
jgi:1-acyl-sn-glycerol-3-phosphate acyltransferase